MFNIGNTENVTSWHSFAILSPLTLFYEIFMKNEIVYQELIHFFKKKSYHVPLLVCDVIYRRLFAVFQLNLHFRHYTLIFEQCLSWQKLFSMIRKIFWKKHILHIMSHFWRTTLSIDVILPFFCNFYDLFPPLGTITWFLSNVDMINIVQHDLGNILKKFSFLYHVPFLTYEVIQPSFCRFSVIFWLNLLFFNLIFKQWWSW